jgi:hypothetical protein
MSVREFTEEENRILNEALRTDEREQSEQHGPVCGQEADDANKDDVEKLVDAILEKGQRPKQADVLIEIPKRGTLFP